jgi:hypothetical protein
VSNSVWHMLTRRGCLPAILLITRKAANLYTGFPLF